MNIDDTHGGFVGPSLIEKIEDNLDEALITFKSAQQSCDSSQKAHGEEELEELKEFWISEAYAEGIAQALGVLRGSSCDEEWERSEKRVTDPKSKKLEREASQAMAGAQVQMNVLDTLRGRG